MRIASSMVLLAAIVVAASSASAAPKARNPKAAAKQHMANAAKASQEGRSEDALKELDAAWALDPQPMLLLARAHLHVKLERCEEAIKLYELFLATSPAQELADSATQAIESCKATLAPPPPTQPPPPVRVTSEEMNLDQENPTMGGSRQAAPVTAEPAPIAMQVDAPTRRTWFRDPLLLGLGGGGVVATVTGLVLYTSARSKASEAASAEFYEQWRVADDDAHRLRRFSIIAGATGVMLIGGAVFYYVSTYRGDDARVAVMPTRGGGVVGYAGSF